jgi:hypothetical protein
MAEHQDLAQLVQLVVEAAELTIQQLPEVQEILQVRVAVAIQAAVVAVVVAVVLVRILAEVAAAPVQLGINHPEINTQPVVALLGKDTQADMEAILLAIVLVMVALDYLVTLQDLVELGQAVVAAEIILDHSAGEARAAALTAALAET